MQAVRVHQFGGLDAIVVEGGRGAGQVLVRVPS